MTTETILTDHTVAIICQQFDPSQDMSLARAIEQSVLQSEQVQEWKRDAERYRKLKSRQDADDEELEFAVIKNAHFDFFQTSQEFEAAIDAAMEKQI